MSYSISLNPKLFKNIAHVGSIHVHFHFHFRIWRIWKILKSGKSEIKENWKVIWQKPRESRSLGSLGVLGVSGVSGVSESQTVNCTIARFSSSLSLSQLSLYSFTINLHRQVKTALLSGDLTSLPAVLQVADFTLLCLFLYLYLYFLCLLFICE